MMVTIRKQFLILLFSLCFFSCGLVAVVSADTSAIESMQARQDIKLLNDLTQSSLEQKAGEGDSLAGLVLANQLSSESQSLAALPVLANSAAEDAARWYSLAARIGALQSRPLVSASVKPLRATRSRRH